MERSKSNNKVKVKRLMMEKEMMEKGDLSPDLIRVWVVESGNPENLI